MDRHHLAAGHSRALRCGPEAGGCGCSMCAASRRRSTCIPLQTCLVVFDKVHILLRESVLAAMSPEQSRTGLAAVTLGLEAESRQPRSPAEARAYLSSSACITGHRHLQPLVWRWVHPTMRASLMPCHVVSLSRKLMACLYVSCG